ALLIGTPQLTTVFQANTTGNAAAAHTLTNSQLWATFGAFVGGFVLAGLAGSWGGGSPEMHAVRRRRDPAAPERMERRAGSRATMRSTIASARPSTAASSMPPSGWSTTAMRQSGSPIVVATRAVRSTKRVVVTTTV